MNSKHFVSIALALAAAGTAGLAQARDAQVQWTVTIGSPLIGIPLPPPPPLPYPVYRVPPQVVVVPAPVLVPRWGHGHRGWRDSDRDGIPDRYDRVDNRRAPGWDRDGDGIPNRYDRYDNRYEYRRDGWHGR